MFGLANAFLVSGVKYYIGTQWEVVDGASRTFARAFWAALVRGHSVGGAVRRARERVLTQDGESDLGWASYPRGFSLILQRAGSRYRLPIYVLENGTADRKDDDTDRQRLLVEHVKEMWLARQHGADVRGYFHWSLLDNFEWAEGFDARFGLIKVDYKDGFRRTPRPSAALYTRIIEHNGLDEDLARHYGLLPE